MPGPYAIEGAGVFVPARIAAGLERELNLDAFRIGVRGRDRELDAVLLAWRSSAARWVEEQLEQGKFRADGTEGDIDRNLADSWNTREVAARTGLTSRAITKAAAAGHLIGERFNGQWQFKPDDVFHWKALRKRGSG